MFGSKLSLTPSALVESEGANREPLKVKSALAQITNAPFNFVPSESATLPDTLYTAMCNVSNNNMKLTVLPGFTGVESEIANAVAPERNRALLYH